MTNSQVISKLTELQSIFPAGGYWNHISGSTQNLDSVSNTPCGTNNYTCNTFASGSQCYAFAYYLANKVFGSYPQVPSDPEKSNGVAYGKWKLYTKGYCNNLTIEPGDIIRTGTSSNGHSAIVHNVIGDSVSVAECWGSRGCKIAWGCFNGSNTNTVTYLLNNATYIIKAPKTTNIVKVTFDKNYTGGESEIIEYDYTTSYGYLPTPSRTNYRFDGWYTDREGGSKFTTSTNVPDYPHTLYAHWTYVSYVTFDYNYEHGPTSETIAFVPGVAYGSGMPTPTRANYRFDGWFTNREGGNRHTSSTNALGWTEYTLYAHWTWMATVTFDLNYSGCPTYQTKMYEPQTAYGFLPTPTRAHYRFDGWYTSREGGSKFTTATIVPGYAHTLYAHWTWMVEVKFYRNHNSSDTTITKTAYCLGGSTYGSSMPTPSRSGYVFKGWFPERSGNGTAWTSSSTVPSYDHNLYAHWKTN